MVTLRCNFLSNDFEGSNQKKKNEKKEKVWKHERKLEDK